MGKLQFLGVAISGLLSVQDPVLVSYYILTDVCKRGDLLVRGSLIYNGYQVRLMG